MFLRHLTLVCLLVPAGLGAPSDKAAPKGFLQGHLDIFSPQPVEPADGDTPSITAESYTEYPLVILSQDAKTLVARVIANEQGNFRVALPPGAYILDVQDRVRKHVRATPQRFSIVANQTTRVDLHMDTGPRMVECPANLVPVDVRQTRMRGA